jgi:DNA-directed RNA polymerase subunit alpha
VLHEFSSLGGVREDPGLRRGRLDIVLNVKQMMRRGFPRKPIWIRITAGQIATTDDIEVMNPNPVICHLANPIVRGFAAGVNGVRFPVGP